MGQMEHEQEMLDDDAAISECEDEGETVSSRNRAASGSFMQWHPDDGEGGMEQTLPGEEGFESGYETDPVERFFKVSRWQKKLHSLQTRLQRAAANRVPRQPGVKESFGRVSRAVRERGKAVQAGVQAVRERGKAVGNRLKDSRIKMVGLRDKYTQQVGEIQANLENLMSRARRAKMRQFRHMVCFCCSMTDLVVSALWLGASPLTFYQYHTFKALLLICLRAIWYRWLGHHYFLFDLCYICNGLLILYLWVFPTSEWLCQAVCGFFGVLLISIPLFRNSFVPHSLDRVTSVQIHLSPAVQMHVLLWHHRAAPQQDFAVPANLSVLPSLCCYFTWVTIYVLDQFFISRKYIERKGYSTLFQHMSEEMGIRKKLPQRCQGPVAIRALFVLGHFTLFLSGLFFMKLPWVVHTISLCICLVWTFKNGASFYITYFWKVYDHQIHSFERQLAAAMETDPGAGAATQDFQSPKREDSQCLDESSEEMSPGLKPVSSEDKMD
eukprot:TRINITY_DN24857_c0_g2_i1.p1 TRINITY_DN24857_c0_g2~~TRINITY_DN24857_c0_g2_i1.p1  ORF type:complete len:496 (+),score=76.48 TRINITY_DN24857_c0_g2_i1:24-1511(+)